MYKSHIHQSERTLISLWWLGTYHTGCKFYFAIYRLNVSLPIFQWTVLQMEDISDRWSCPLVCWSRLKLPYKSQIKPIFSNCVLWYHVGNLKSGMMGVFTTEIGSCYNLGLTFIDQLLSNFFLLKMKLSYSDHGLHLSFQITVFFFKLKYPRYTLLC